MKIALLTWSDGENDPFTSFNETLRDEFAKCGREAILVKIDSQISQNIRKLKETGLDFAITWQGLGSNFKNADSNQCIWDEWKVPLFCIHSDHPSQMLDNHQALSSHVRHLYSTSSFNHYANRHIKRTHPALMFKPPILNQQKKLAVQDGNYFVFVKNLDDTFSTLQNWQNRLPPLLLKLLTDCALAITESLQKMHLRITIQ